LAKLVIGFHLSEGPVERSSFVDETSSKEDHEQGCS